MNVSIRNKENVNFFITNKSNIVHYTFPAIFMFKDLSRFQQFLLFLRHSVLKKIENECGKYLKPQQYHNLQPLTPYANSCELRVIPLNIFQHFPKKIMYNLLHFGNPQVFSGDNIENYPQLNCFIATLQNCKIAF